MCALFFPHCASCIFKSTWKLCLHFGNNCEVNTHIITAQDKKENIATAIALLHLLTDKYHFKFNDDSSFAFFFKMMHSSIKLSLSILNFILIESDCKFSFASSLFSTSCLWDRSLLLREAEVDLFIVNNIPLYDMPQSIMHLTGDEIWVVSSMGSWILMLWTLLNMHLGKQTWVSGAVVFKF